ncbi:hypothetical protein J5N97_000405 [Dioscorea zingiberensis]|uniref:Uncharacterized protein n=1 Tax=Dioscorea zingiberensis TaxID=325984 RepID=A0A9D5BS94_9LILI|nr:hypothetical protein J5N97_000405 [Dioscorea zingiberensis]
MVSSEIEIVSSSSSDSKPLDQNPTAVAVAVEVPIIDVFSASALRRFPQTQEHGGDVDATVENIEADSIALGSRAGGSAIAAADVLLQNGARFTLVAQYGQTSFLNHIIAKYHADFDAPDNEGRSPFFIGSLAIAFNHPSVKSFLSYAKKKLKFPLHWAALKGNVEACTVLVHAGTKQELMVKDNAGFTPVQIASDKGHQRVASFPRRVNSVLILPQ